jgi:D-glycero-D-manno-heptose 1,7-bisphosphate phosphatase
MQIKDKIVSRDSLVSLIPKFKSEGKVVGFSSGAFDLLHAGHAEYLELAKAKCDVLIVGLNSDKSVASYKNPDRPINSEVARSQVLAALSSVDYVFIFDELNNNENIQQLKPDIYIKAGDYSKDKLSSAPIVESYGGRVELINFKSGYSSSAIVDKISNQAIRPFFESGQTAVTDKSPVVFLDRDGTINEEISYLHETEKLKLIPGTVEALKIFSDAGFRIVIVTNQPGIGLGYFTKEDFFKVTRAMFAAISGSGAKISKVYFCPHSESEACLCRKPGTALLERAKSELNIDLEKSYMIGDMTSDIKAGTDFGIKTVLVKTGSAGSDKKFEVKPSFFAENLLEAAKIITGA